MLGRQFFFKDSILKFASVFLLLLCFILPSLESFAQETVIDTLTVSRLDSLNKRRISPSFLLWPSLRTNPLFPNQNPYRPQYSPFYPSPSLRQNIRVEMDSTLKYRIQDELDSASLTPGVIYDFDEFSKIQEFKVRQEYWRTRSRGMDGESPVTGRDISIPFTSSPQFDRIFGGDEITLVPTGFVNLDLGAIFRRIDNPAIPIRQQQNGNFNFNQQIQMAVNGSLGQKMRMAANFDSNNSFDFQNQLKVEYQGFKEDIIKSIEIGNVSMPVQNSLIHGAQNLFGVKTQMQFGNLFVTSVASTQRGRRDELVIEAGGQGRMFEIQGSNYDENRHFFLAHFFRDNYERWLRGIPQILSGVNITRVEVYIMNRANNTETLRNFVSFMDLGEGTRIFRPTNPNIGTGSPGSPAANNANLLFQNLLANPSFRPADTGSSAIESSLQLTRGIDFEQVSGARKLGPNEFFFHRELGYISLSRRLQNDEVLAVSFEYTFNGQVFKVGEMSEDYQNRPQNEFIYLKMLRPARININIPTWDLMMKNIYNLNANQVMRDGFQLQVIYRDDRTGLDNPTLLEGENVRNRPLIRLMGLDNLNPQNDPAPDGNFDFVPGITIFPDRGLLAFPVLEPFGRTLRNLFLPNERNLADRFVFDTLYRTTRADAELVTRYDKFFIKGRLTAGSASEILLPGLNISPGSVIVMAGNIPLTEGVDFTVDYNIGRVNIINESILQSGKRISISFEKADLVSFQTRSLLGTRLDYAVNEKLSLGGTFLYLNERPNITRIATGAETLRNSMWGLDANFSDESRFLTKLADFLPFTNTKEKSLVTFSGEFAQLLPGTSNRVAGEPTVYIDDFETAITPYGLGNAAAQTWRLAATPKTDNDQFDLSSTTEDRLGNTYRRAKLAWYNIDNVFYRESGPGVPGNITREDRQNHYVRRVIPQEIFQSRDRDVIIVPEPLFELAYFPSERGMYNYNPALTPDGFLPNPRLNYGGVTRAITTEVDFDRTNVEYIEFWLLDPFIQGPNGRVLDGKFNQNNTTGGKLRFNLGEISEDVVKDSRHGFENGLPADGDFSQTATTEWGRITRQQFLIPAFDNSPEARTNQDVGLDGLNSAEEAEFFRDRFLNRLNVTPQVLQEIEADPSADNFKYYLDQDFDNRDIKILERYKNFNGMEGNTPITSNVNLPFTPSGSNLPDNEDLNNDNTINELEAYYEYEIDLRPGQLEVGRGYIVDRVTSIQSGDEVSWYLFRIPVRNPDRVQGEISGFKSIRFMRTYLTDFEQPVVLRMANFRLVASQWRVFQESLFERGFFEIPEPDNSNFTVGVVNIEENSQGSATQSPYVLPPGITRDRDNLAAVERQLNEQSLRLCVEDLQARDARAVFKNTGSLNLVQYERIKMFFHADSEDAENGELTAFIRMGTDYTDNYYEIEVPLLITPKGTRDPRQIWPLENELDIAIKEIVGVKVDRDNQRVPLNLAFTQEIRQYKVTVVGRPELSLIQGMMIGIRNPGATGGGSRSICIWANELRVTGFIESSGWAANAILNTQIADVATISTSIRHNTVGFGGLETRLSQRSLESATQYDISANVSVEKLLPEALNMTIPMYASMENITVRPEYDPLNPDVPLRLALDKFQSDAERDLYRSQVLDLMKRRNIGFSNVRKNRNPAKESVKIYDLSNFSVSYAFGSVRQSNINTARYEFETRVGNIAYVYQPKPLILEPFKNAEWSGGSGFRLIRDINFNFVPTSVSARVDLDRRFMRTQFRNDQLTTDGVDPFYQKSFFLNRTFNVNWDLTKNLRVDLMSRNFSVVDEPEGARDTQEARDSVRVNLRNFGRTTNYTHQLMANYKLPLDKVKALDWIGMDYRYSANYAWLTGAIGQRDTLGNVIQNTRDRAITGKLDLVKLYNKNAKLRALYAPRRPSIPGRQVVNAEDTIGTPFTNKLIKFLTMVKDINFRYSVVEGTFLPGYMENTGLLGLDRSFLNPGLGFIFGSQDPNLRFRLAEDGLMAPSVELTQAFRQNKAVNLQLTALAEPFKDFRINFEARKRETGEYSEIFRNSGDPDLRFSSLSPNRLGGYSITYSIIRTAFVRDDNNNNSPVFRQLENNRAVIQARLNAQNPGGEFGLNGQDVLTLAFLSAYSGRDANSINLNPLPQIPLPNWRVDYRGLSQIPALREYFSSINLTHGYASTYEVSNFSNSLLYQQGLELFNRVSNIIPGANLTDEFGQFIPIFILNQVILTERFAPLIGVNLLTKDRLNIAMEYNTERNLGLNFSNAQVTEQNSRDFGFDLGYTKAGVKVPFKIQGRQEVLKNDLQLRLNTRVVDTRQVQRKIEDVNTVTNGNLNLQIRPTVGYVINQNLNIQIYFDRTINDPRVTTAFRRSSTAFGGQLRFNLSQ
ncbi:cell surface protein SprA [Cecembia calidifontis]|uniref:Cell surface protein SprA n=1 Tax=Cecembia calidifontis TaxID=1187080 RepID=A0A4Q7P8G2_9BACT|nr:cell surface protein SprA [Cecembia calidifontis]RZS96157.1 cell surface protein SprA [Cecembia calidifontis]